MTHVPQLRLTLARPRSDAASIASSLERSGEFADVFERHHGAVHAYLTRRLGVDMADEIAAEAFAVAFARRHTYDSSRDDARPWLYGIATRLASRHWRREERQLRAYARTGVDPCSPSHEESATERVSVAAAGPALAAALASLSADERDVLLLYAWAELGYPEIAAALSISAGTVKSRLHRARARVRESLALAGELDQRFASDE